MDGWSDEKFAFDPPRDKQVYRAKKPTPVPDTLLNWGPMYQVVVVVVSLKKYELSGAEKVPLNRELVIGSVFILGRNTSHCYTAAHYLGGVTTVNGSIYVLEPEAAVVMHFPSLTKFDDGLVKVLTGMAEAQFNIALPPAETGTGVQKPPCPGIAKVLGFRSSAGERLQQVRDLLEENVELTMENGLRIPRSGRDVAVLQLDRSFLRPGLSLVSKKIVVPCLVGLLDPPLSEGPLPPNFSTRNWTLNERPVAYGFGIGNHGLERPTKKMMFSGLYENSPQKGNIVFSDPDPLDVTNGYCHFYGTLAEGQAGGPVLLSPSSEYAQLSTDRTLEWAAGKPSYIARLLLEDLQFINHR